MSIYDIEVKDIDMNSIKMEEFKGKTLLIVNVASACGFTPQYTGLQNLYDKYEEQKIKFFLIDITEATRTVKGLENMPKAGPFLAKKGLTMPILYDSRGVAKERYGAKTLPRLYVIDKYRTIRLAKKGFSEGEDFEGEVSAVIDMLLAEK